MCLVAVVVIAAVVVFLFSLCLLSVAASPRVYCYRIFSSAIIVVSSSFYCAEHVIFMSTTDHMIYL